MELPCLLIFPALEFHEGKNTPGSFSGGWLFCSGISEISDMKVDFSPHRLAIIHSKPTLIRILHFHLGLTPMIFFLALASI